MLRQPGCLGFLRLSHDDCTKISLKPMAFPRRA
jgi:hypothetical protein